MRRIVLLVGLASCVVFGGGEAQASPLKLQIWGSANTLEIFSNSAAMLDVTDGLSGFTRTGGRHLTGGAGTPSTQPVDSSMLLWATLYDGDRTLAWAQFSAPVTGGLSYESMLGRFSGGAHGSANAVATLGQGVDPGMIPSWFTGLSAKVDSVVTGGHANDFQTTLTLASNPAPVPEPSSVLVFLAAAGFVARRRLRRA